jgi:phosphoglycolate phosphatase-like HAD superfamily hydrolase
MTSPITYYRAKAFVFDLDGTLIDTSPLVERFWREFALEHGLDGDKVNAYIDREKKKAIVLFSNTASCHISWCTYN